MPAVEPVIVELGIGTYPNAPFYARAAPGDAREGRGVGLGKREVLLGQVKLGAGVGLG